MISKEVKRGFTASEKKVRPTLDQRGEPALTLASGDGSTLDYYFRDMGEARQRRPLLTPQDEVKLAKRIEAGRGASEKLDSGINLSPAERSGLMLLKKEGERARTDFVEANLGLVVSTARRHLGKGIEFPDLIQEGNLGLMKAVEKFDWRRGFRFSTYATWRIRQAITRAISDRGRTIRLPVHAGEEVSRYTRTKNFLTGELEREPTAAEIAEAMELSPEDVRKLKLWESGRLVSLDIPIGEDEDGVLADLVVDEDFSKEFDDLGDREEVKKILERLDPRVRRVVEKRHGLFNGEKMTLEEIGNSEGVTRERIRQILKGAEAKLRGEAYRRSARRERPNLRLI